MLEKLETPPINEVVCGFIFEPIPELDPILLGAYWHSRRSEYPKREVQPPVVDAPFIHRGLGPVRCWFTGADDVFLLQIQPDRFYLNWRRREGDYPRFSDHVGKAPGILSLALKEFEMFADFCVAEIGRRPVPGKIDLAKIDILESPAHWKNFADLVRLVPCLNSFSAFATTERPEVAFRYVEQRDGGTLLVSMDTGAAAGVDGTSLLKIETRLAGIEATDIRANFERANVALNDVFAALIPKEQRDAKFSHGR